MLRQPRTRAARIVLKAFREVHVSTPPKKKKHQVKSRVLVVDDQPDAAEVVSVLLAIMGHETQAASSGAEALERAETFDPDVVLLDLQLPDVSGYEVARQLRRRAGRRPLHIAAVTALAHPDDRARSHAAGMDQHLVKPASEAKLRQVISIADLKARAARSA